MENALTMKESVELFHLLFLEQLGQKLDRRLYAVKGGCNLRFFLGSVRYSEDLDIDVHTVAPETLKNGVNKIVEGTPFKQILKARGIAIENVSASKQTATTQRWKIQLRVGVSSLAIPTKIEFSRRRMKKGILAETVLSELMIKYRLRPIFVSHYDPEAAYHQKILALIHRTETQARDVFDLHHLLQTQKILNVVVTEEEKKIAMTQAMSINFPHFKSQVVAYLEPEYRAQYDDPMIWDQLVMKVCAHLGGL